MSTLVVARPAAEIIAEVSGRSRGGDHRAAGADRRTRGRAVEAQRCSSSGEGWYVDVYDAASVIGSHCVFWAPEQILSLPAVTSLGRKEALTRLEEQLAGVSLRERMTRSGRERVRRIRGDIESVELSSRVLFEAHRIGVVRA